MQIECRMTESDPRSQPTYLINRSAKLLARICDERLRPIGFSVAQLPVLGALKQGSLSQKELTRICEIGQPAMAQMLARMERDGLVRRALDPEDARSSLFSLTEKAREGLPEGRRILSEVKDEALAGLAARDVALLVAALQRVGRNLEAMIERLGSPQAGEK